MQNGVIGYANTLPAKKLLIDGITRDLPIEACIFDLIDNSIDSNPQQKQIITLAFNGHHFSIEDNGCGISYAKMETEALSAGSIEPHENGIGAFGIGLNRALYKLGKEINIYSETYMERVVVLNWSIPEYMKSPSWNVPIARQETLGKTGTSITISDLNDEASTTLSDNTWVEELKKEIAKRYALFIDKGLKIFINGEKIKSNKPKFRADSKFSHPKREFKSGSVSIEIICGEHIRHKFPNEKGHREKVNKKLTGEYGWYVYCNNRGILLNDRSVKTGWKTMEHSQHNGFIGIAYFNGPSELLPWTTDKVDVDAANPVYTEALKSMEEASKVWRTFTGRMRKWQPEGVQDENKEDVEAEGALEPDTGDVQEGESDGESSTPDEPSESNEHDDDNEDESFPVQGHPESWAYLFGPKKNSRVRFRIPQDEKKLLAVVKELQGLKLSEHPCATMLLLRVLIEESCKLYRRRNANKPSCPRSLSLAKTVEVCLDSMITRNMVSDEHEINAIRTLCVDRGKRVLSIEYLQNSVHSSKSFLSAGVIRPFWDEIEAFIAACFK